MQSVKQAGRETSRLVLTGILCLLMVGLIVGCETSNGTKGALQPMPEQHSHPESASVEDVRAEIQSMVGPVVESLVQETTASITRLQNQLEELVYAKECHSEVLIEVHEVGNNKEFVKKLNAFLADDIHTMKDENGRRLYTGPKGVPIHDVSNKVLQRFVSEKRADQDAINRIRSGNGVGYYFGRMAKTEFDNIRAGIESLAESNGLNVPLAAAKDFGLCDTPSAYSRHVSVVGTVEAEEIEEEFVEINVTLKVQNVSDSSTVWLMPEQRFLSKLSGLSPAPIFTINGRAVPKFSVPYGAELPNGGQLQVNIRHSRVKKDDVPLGNVYALILRDTTIAGDQFRITRFSMVEIDEPNGSFPDQPLPVDNPARQPACPPSNVSGLAGRTLEGIIGNCL